MDKRVTIERNNQEYGGAKKHTSSNSLDSSKSSSLNSKHANETMVSCV